MLAHAVKLEYIGPNFVKLTPKHMPPAGHFGYDTWQRKVNI